MAYIFKIISTAMKEKKREKEMDGDVGGDGAECKRKKREREREGNRRKHMPWRLVPRRSKAYLASSCSCFIARGTAAAQTALPRAPFFLCSPMRLVASRFSTYGARGAAPEGPTASLKRAVVPGYLPFTASELFPKSLSPKNPATDRDVRGAGRKVVRRFEGERVGRTSHLDSSFVARAETRTCTAISFSLSLFLSFYHSLPVPTAIKNLPRDCLPAGATDWLIPL